MEFLPNQHYQFGSTPWKPQGCDCQQKLWTFCLLRISINLHLPRVSSSLQGIKTIPKWKFGRPTFFEPTYRKGGPISFWDNWIFKFWIKRKKLPKIKPFEGKRSRNPQKKHYPRECHHGSTAPFRPYCFFTKSFATKKYKLGKANLMVGSAVLLVVGWLVALFRPGFVSRGVFHQTLSSRSSILGRISVELQSDNDRVIHLADCGWFCGLLPTNDLHVYIYIYIKYIFELHATLYMDVRGCYSFVQLKK